MKHIALILLFVSSLANASGKLQFMPKYSIEEKTTSPAVGLSIWEPIMQPVFYSQWTGGGFESMSLGKKHWVTSNHDVVLVAGPLQVGLGLGIEWSSHPIEALSGKEHFVRGKVSYNLW